MKRVTRTEAVELIRNATGFFSILYKKRTPNAEGRQELTTMNCRMGVTKHLTGNTTPEEQEKMARERANAKLITVYSLDRKGYRSVGIEGLRQVIIDGEVHVVH